MPREVISTDKAPKAIGPYEQAIKVSGFVFTAGQIALDPESGDLVPGGISEQAHRVLENLKAVVEAAGSSLDRAVKTTIYLKNIGDFALINAIYEDYFGAAKPARSTVAVAELPKEALIEIDVIAEA